ncbi:kinase-like domain-containing protein [Rhizophagus irregularis DAOM 181602=DAOM 197198]|uniref:Serine-threonine/tyrosine-protein kinase catalytic domain-containing protein n=1 Tax=Rhizophagus irregularis (strain DAOM 181602 / DAOM 197198 / MUCL 43194) TaxID=747089 RepID=A0A2P4QB73_RHIID|nr:hypothetical protein GLOIN_2v1873326 [Rhizophagus irregularis DAOM 181602=DAOM 197198]POG74894.1 hypothetical protein GLOIN_2v1873326 [Rhizophagus irregularis DAOM 181602=DAOM 197198]GET53915.1 kinase-like domain-containing protein [Rhizophagus irregularis DAOM 181602=DAOM 197198]|eukprot:XP_025181760.1 hypothetical protein GLOIN_2v1873326 [Rhizophagus irregularis DAOM 181602=DAOM 197198]
MDFRPEFGKGTPELLAYKCMDANPDQRPTAIELYEIIDFWDQKNLSNPITNSPIIASLYLNDEENNKDCKDSQLFKLAFMDNNAASDLTGIFKEVGLQTDDWGPSYENPPQGYIFESGALVKVPEYKSSGSNSPS